MFERLCGKVALQNVIITTTMWNKLDATLESQWEIELKKGWEVMLSRGSTSNRFRNTSDSAWDILDNLLDRKDRHAIRLQTEMVDLGLQLHETSAGRAWDIQSYAFLMYYYFR